MIPETKANEFESTHGLDFEVAPWNPNESFLATMMELILPEGAHMQFRVGTCSGLWRSEPDNYIILCVVNDSPGNGHFEDVLEWFYHSCRRDGKGLVIEEVWNEDFKEHLIFKRGFAQMLGTDHVMKGCQAIMQEEIS